MTKKRLLSKLNYSRSHSQSKAAFSGKCGNEVLCDRAPFTTSRSTIASRSAIRPQRNKTKNSQTKKPKGNQQSPTFPQKTTPKPTNQSDQLTVPLSTNQSDQLTVPLSEHRLKEKKRVKTKSLPKKTATHLDSELGSRAGGGMRGD